MGTANLAAPDELEERSERIGFGLIGGRDLRPQGTRKRSKQSKFLRIDANGRSGGRCIERPNAEQKLVNQPSSHGGNYAFSKVAIKLVVGPLYALLIAIGAQGPFAGDFGKSTGTSRQGFNRPKVGIMNSHPSSDINEYKGSPSI